MGDLGSAVGGSAQRASEFLAQGFDDFWAKFYLFDVFDAFDLLSLQPVSKDAMIYVAGEHSSNGAYLTHAWGEPSTHTSCRELKVLQGACMKMEQL